ncbi:MAG: polyphosphate polymerase domain-containing protein [Slackia sp.]|nr:polyphosphate polymerase domain-containing protein [Slackia sp.]
MAEFHFERKEVKYRLSAVQHKAILSAFRGRLAPDVYGSSLVKSVYFDTDKRDMIAHSLEKPLYKEKLRVRSYGTPSESDLVFVEVKKKYDGVVYKRRIAMSYAAARAYLGGTSYEAACAAYPLDNPGVSNAFSPVNIQVAREIDAIMHRWGPLRASMLTTCVRTAYGPIDESGAGVADEEGLRVTFDASLGYCDLHAPRAGVKTFPLIGPEETIMEVKSRGPYPLWLADALDACGAYPSSFSKYGEAYRRCASNMGFLLEVGSRPEVRCA